ncbi:hypothetical protein LTR50_001397 [Elasticomyces elasticus]|nr:hypothetical protein LTR50_001397 [Elasticomyces elasticus]
MAPTQEQIRQFVDFVECDPAIAERFLLVACKDDLDAAAEAYFKKHDPLEALRDVERQYASTNTWDEQALHADRDGGPDPNAEQGTQNLKLPLSNAPTRGPSPAPSFRQPVTQDEADADFAAAMAASQQDLSSIAQTGTYFGPATREQYDPNKWAVTVAGPVDTSVVDVEDPRDRGASTAYPRFVRPTNKNKYLANFLTICHSIPKAREALLRRKHDFPTYGENPDWWRGDPIRFPTTTRKSTFSDWEKRTTSDNEELVTEMQRIMAFLGNSDRWYCSADSLSQLSAVTNLKKTYSDEPGPSLELARVLEAWEQAAEEVFGGDPLNHIFHSVAGRSPSEGPSKFDFWVLTSPVSTSESRSLNEWILHTLWSKAGESATQWWLDINPDVLPMILSTGDRDTPINVDIPITLDLSLYQEHNSKELQEILEAIGVFRQQIQHIEALQVKLRERRHPQTGIVTTAEDLLRASQRHFSKQLVKLSQEKAKDSENSVSQTDLQRNIDRFDSIVRKIDLAIDDIRKKLEALEELKVFQREQYSAVCCKHPTAVDGSATYYLRGVSTWPTRTYVLRPRPDQPLDPYLLASQQVIDDPDAPQGMQWWCINYENVSEPISTNPCLTYEVLAAVKGQGDVSALLVYARKEALDDEQGSMLLPNLWNFVVRDNELFEQELEDWDKKKTASYNSRTTGNRPIAPRPATSLRQYGSGDAHPSIEGAASRLEEYDAGLSYDTGNASPPAAEIHLDEAVGLDTNNQSPSSEAFRNGAEDSIMSNDLPHVAADVEMQERNPVPLLTQMQPDHQRRESDATMVGSDDGMGGEHVEHMNGK